MAEEVKQTENEETVDYKALYEKAQKDNANLDKYNKDLKAKYQAKMTEEEKRNAEIAEKESYYKALERELSVSKLKASLNTRVTDEAALEEITSKFADGDTLGGLAQLVKLWESGEKALRKTIEQELLQKNPTPPPVATPTKSWKDMAASDWNDLQANNPAEYAKMIAQIGKKE